MYSIRPDVARQEKRLHAASNIEKEFKMLLTLIATQHVIVAFKIRL